ncbi:hypothetical protein C8J57DRAFT_1532137 [Mycena rebaudengoi]|nr:hypothetical protein C8J57DRAFT_1532137 [Mycena rebaudengoi]
MARRGSPSKAKSRARKKPVTSPSASPSKPTRAPSSRKPKAPKRADADVDDGKAGKSSGPHIYWDKDTSRTERLLDWLDNNPADRQKLFSDSTKDASKEGRKARKASGAKTIYYTKIADAVFSVDADPAVREAFKKDSTPYVRSVENYVSRLKSEYHDFNTELGQTGAGLKYEDITPGSDIHNKIELLKASFPWWERLHGYWRTLPNFNPFTVSSEPGQDVAAQALALLMDGRESVAPQSPPWDIEKELDKEEEHEGSENPFTPVDDDDSEQASKQTSVPAPRNAGMQSDTSSSTITPPTSPTPVKLQLLAKSAASRASMKENSATTPSATKPRGKRSRVEAFAEESRLQVETLARLGQQKHERCLVELEVKKRRLDVDALEKQQAYQHENMLVEERRLAAEDRRREEQFKRDREREKHELEMMRFKWMMQNGGGSNVAPLDMPKCDGGNTSNVGAAEETKGGRVNEAGSFSSFNMQGGSSRNNSGAGIFGGVDDMFGLVNVRGSEMLDQFAAMDGMDKFVGMDSTTGFGGNLGGN